jgi:hypothetical protein
MARKNRKRSRVSSNNQVSNPYQSPCIAKVLVADDPSLSWEDKKSQTILAASVPVTVNAVCFRAENDDSKKISVVARKRNLKSIVFVKPRVNGVVEHFDFLPTKRQASPEAAAGNHATTSILTSQTTTQSHAAADYSKSKNEISKKPETFTPLDSQKTNAEIHKTSDMGYRNYQQTTNKHSKDTTEGILHMTTEFASESNHHHRCSLSGISVEDAIQDKLGLRPRSNSTDGELKLPQRGLCYEHEVLEKFKWNFEMRSVPAGFNNLGNTCFLNSTMPTTLLSINNGAE